MIKRSLTVLVLLLVVTTPAFAGFNEIARAIESKRGVDRVWIPFLGFARMAVRLVEPEGVRDFQFATFEGADKLDPRELQSILRSKVGPGFKPLVQVWSRKSSEWSFIYARPSRDGSTIELMLLAHDHEDTVLIRVAVDAEVLARELGESPRGVVSVAGR